MSPGAAKAGLALAAMLASSSACRPGRADREPAENAAEAINPITEIARLRTEIDTLPFPEVIAATTVHEVLPIPEDSPFLEFLPPIFDAVLQELSAADSPVRDLRRINEASRFFEDAIAVKINAHPEFECVFPKTAAGKTQRSGYPDLLLRHRPSGTIAYLDPKLFEASNRDSSLRTFYYEPKGETGKIHHDAHHLLVGIAHDGNEGEWRFESWELVDLHRFRVRLKAEFQGSNRDLYRDELILRSNRTAAEPPPGAR